MAAKLFWALNNALGGHATPDEKAQIKLLMEVLRDLVELKGGQK